MKLVGTREHDNRNPSITQNRELMSFLEQTISSLGIRHLSVGLVLYPLDLDLPSRHFSSLYLVFDILLKRFGEEDKEIVI